MKRALLGFAGIAALVAVTAFFLGVTRSGGGGGGSQKVNIIFDNAFGLSQGGDLRVAGVRAGKISGFDISNGQPPKAVVHAEIDDPGLRGLKTDASCAVRQQSLIGEYFVDCQPGSAPTKLADNGTVPVAQTQSTIPVDLIQNVMTQPYRERLAIIISELGVGLAGRPQDLSEVLHRADPGLRETTKTLQILDSENKTIQDWITNSDTIVADLDSKKQQVADFVTQAAKANGASAPQKANIEASLQKFPTLLDELRPTMVQLGQFIDAQLPLLGDLRQAAPAFNQFNQVEGPFANASLPSLQSLGQTSKIGSQAITNSQPDINQLQTLSEQAPGLARPLRQLLQSLDDRSKSTDYTPLARELAPPPPDKTSASHGPGLTGFESIMNYLYNQTLSTNAFDKESHVLRAYSLFPGVNTPSPPGPPGTPGCGVYTTQPTPWQVQNCGSWLGPNQPGVNRPDPTGGGGSSQSASAPAAPGPPPNPIPPLGPAPLPGPALPAPPPGAPAPGPALPGPNQPPPPPPPGPAPPPPLPAPNIPAPSPQGQMLNYLLGP